MDATLANSIQKEITKIRKDTGATEKEAYYLLGHLVKGNNLKANDLLGINKSFLDSSHNRFKKGDRFEILFSIFLCLISDFPVPDWVVEDFTKGIVNYAYCNKRTLDESFNIRRPKGFNLKAAKREIAISDRMCEIALELKEKGRPTDDGFFEEIGESVGIGKTLAKKIYYSWFVKWLHFQAFDTLLETFLKKK